MNVRSNGHSESYIGSKVNLQKIKRGITIIKSLMVNNKENILGQPQIKEDFVTPQHQWIIAYNENDKMKGR